MGLMLEMLKVCGLIYLQCIYKSIHLPVHTFIHLFLCLSINLSIVLSTIWAICNLNFFAHISTILFFTICTSQAQARVCLFFFFFQVGDF